MSWDMSEEYGFLFYKKLLLFIAVDSNMGFPNEQKYSLLGEAIAPYTPLLIGLFFHFIIKHDQKVEDLKKVDNYEDR